MLVLKFELLDGEVRIPDGFCYDHLKRSSEIDLH